MQVFADGANLALSFPYSQIDVEHAKGIPQRRFDATRKLWLFRPSVSNMEYVRTWFPSAEWCPKSQNYWTQALVKKEERDALAYGKEPEGTLEGTLFKFPPFAHQERALLLGRNKDAFAYLMDQGTGKTKVLLDDAAHNFRIGKINALLVICPNSVKTNWVNPDGGEDEVSKHMAPDVPYSKECWQSNASGKRLNYLLQFIRGQFKTNVSTLQILSVNVEGLAHDRVVKELETFVKNSRCMIVVDESTRIKNRTAKRTKNVMKLRRMSVLARIMSGTPLIKSPLNAFSQFGFLDEDVLGYSNYYAFQSRYAIMGGYEGRQVLRFQNLDELSHKVAGISYRVLKDDCLDLPPKVYSKRIVELTDEQEKAYEVAKQREISNLEDLGKYGGLRADNVLTMLLRLQQITAGFVPILDEFGQSTGTELIPGPNPKINELMSILEEVDGKVIIWCKFVAELELVKQALNKAGIVHCLFYGAVSEQDRIKAREAFQNDEATRVFVGQVQTGGIGITLTAASTVVYLSNTFSTEDRVQSEDRAHRIGQEKSVDYIDIIAAKTVDQKILTVLRSNKQVADEVMRDGYKEWI